MVSSWKLYASAEAKMKTEKREGGKSELGEKAVFEARNTDSGTTILHVLACNLPKS